MTLDFKAISLAGGMVIAAGGAAFAADLSPSYTSAPSYEAADARSAAGVSWQGISVGVLGAYGIGDGTMTVKEKRDPVAGFVKFDPKGPMVGGLLGLHGQTGNFVYGAELDGSFSMMKAKGSTDISSSDLPTDMAKALGLTTGSLPMKFTASINSYYTARARFGYATGSLLFYGTGGLALARAKTKAETKIGGLAMSETASGYALTPVIGGGIEHKFTNNLSLRTEYLYSMPFDVGLKGTFKKAPTETVKYSQKATFDGTHLIRVGLSYGLPVF